MLNICKQLFNKWNTDIRYCHWKSNEHLSEGLNGLTDLDVFVYPDDKNKAEEHLRLNRYIKFQPQKGCRYPLVDEWLGFDEETGKLVHVHLHYQVITGTKYCKEFVFPIDKLIIESRVLDENNNVYIASPDLEIIVLYSRIVLKAKTPNNINLSKDYEREILWLKDRVSWMNVEAYCKEFFGDNYMQFLSFLKSDMLSKEQWYRLYQIVEHWLHSNKKMSRLEVFFKHHYHYFRLGLLSTINYKFDKCNIVKKTLQTKGISVCFLGQDGSGKSTVSIEIEKWLDWKVSVHRFYLGSGEHYHSIFKSIIDLKNRMLPSSKTKPSDSIHHSEIETKKKNDGGIIRNIKDVIVCLNLVTIAKRAYREVKKSVSYKQKGAIALYDRFPQNQYVGIYDGPKIEQSFRLSGLIGALAKRERKYIEMAQQYQPNLLFKLVLPPEESIRRKPFEIYEDVKKKSVITEKLHFVNSEEHMIDATQDYEKEILTIKNIIWIYLVKMQL